jgi:hypothetical protein
MVKDLYRIDKLKNRIYLYFEGYMEIDRAKQLHDAYKEAIEKCSRGFTVVTLAENYKPSGQEVQDIVLTMTRMAENAGCRKVARVVGQKPLGGMQINRIAKAMTTYPSRHFATIEEADEYLDSDKDE